MRVAQLRRLLEPLLLGRIHHPPAQRVDQLVVAPLQQQLRAGHSDAVLLLRADLTHARRDAALDVVLQARPSALAGDHLVARSDAEQPMRQPHRPPRDFCWQERPCIEIAVAFHAAGDQHPWKILAHRQLQERIVLVIAQQDVVFRRALLDEIILECQRFHHRVGDDDFNCGNLVEQRVVTRAQAGGGEIAADAVAQRARLADVNRVARSVDPQIHAGLLGQPRDLLLEVVDGHGLVWRL